jgi:uncharacterized membrane protein
MTPLRTLVWLVLGALVVGAVFAYPQLPASVPQNIGADGRAGGFVPRSPYAWGMPVLIAVAIFAGLEWIRTQLPHRPALFNFSGKEQLQRLPVEYRGGVIARMQRFMDVVNLQVVCTFMLVQWMLWCGAHGATSETLTVALLVLSPAMIVVAGLGVSGIQNELDRAQRAYDSRRHPQRP